ncbi:MAG: UvrD-helicase domain-containing protein [Bacteroidetes bacterium]|nr:UvrD-helicase domain-containing protein [Bacteroidota bacterium]MBU1116568.1 UvrD-helicase domain-containing protein [Bacteroidota bacterium]MBU1797542.1 UvrD-helicase domain-containing protein [Bacteroidota bacterium]
MYNLTQYQKEALNHSRHISLTANAGSGKTFVLVRRFLSILYEENISLNNIVAITFTEKAASELYKRIAGEIETRLKEETQSSQIKKLERLRRELVSAKISTIHSFCTELLKEFPTEAGIDANFIPIDQRVSDELISSSIDEIIQKTIRNNDSLIEFVKRNIRLLGSKKILKSVLKGMISRRQDIEKLEETLYKQSDTETAEIFRNKFEMFFELIFSENIKHLFTAVETINERAESIKHENEIVARVKKLLVSTKNQNDIFATISIVKNIFAEILILKGTIKATGYLPNKFREGIYNNIDFVENFYSEFKIIDYSDDYKSAELELAKCGYDILNLWKPIMARYNQKKMQRGFLDFEDLLLMAEKLVQRDDVKSYLASRYEYFMIDEYQDTNETQYNIFIPILDYLNRGNLFIVGDEKQSIYMFRGADLQIFNKTKDAIKNANDENSLLQLPHSFRLSKELTLFTNKLFGKLFESPNLMFNEVKYDELIYAKKEDKESEIAFLISDGSQDSESEYRLVAKKIIELVENNNIEFKDIAILARKRKVFVELEKELQKLNIPYQIYGGKGFYQRQEIYDVYNYLSFLLNPKNDEALIAILRSPFFVRSDKSLFEISKLNGESFYEKLLLFSNTNVEFKDITFQLIADIQNAKSKQLSVLLRDVLQESGYWSKVAILKNSKQIFSNLDKLISTAVSFLDKGSTTLYDFVSFLREGIDKTEDESQAVISENDKNVKLMTIHASKGLEFPVLFLIDTNSKGLDDKVKSKSISIDKEFGILTKTSNESYSETNTTAPIIGIYNYISMKKSNAELKRLLYVAVTRAESYLFISATLKVDAVPANQSFLALFKEGLRIEEFVGIKKISGNITFMREGENGFTNSETEVNLEIPFIKQIETETENGISKNEFYEIEDSSLQIKINSISDVEQNEIISASKISVYNQCPLKYNLVYDLGFTSLFYKEKEQDVYLDFSNENIGENISIPANVQGSIIHKLLEEETARENLVKRVEELLLLNSEVLSANELQETKLTIVNMVNNYYDSDIYRSISKFDNYKNEYEIYIKQKDFYLYGIIDKIIFENGTAHIIDYKTDSLKKYSAQEKLENYKYQLMFYAYLVNRMNPLIENIVCKLVFIEAPDENASINVTKEILQEFETNMHLGITAMRNSIYNKNKSHCKSCYFSDKNYNCIVE